MDTIIITSKEQLIEIVRNAVATELTNKQPLNNSNKRVAITSIRQGAQFIGCSEPKFQSIKNSGKIRFYQSGRKFLIYTDELLEDLSGFTTKNRNK